jgi:crossover junction endodeoxyribonuclease RusA
MRQEIYFTAFGDPAPQGSKRYVGNGIMIEASKKIPAWRKAVAEAVYRTFVATGDSSMFVEPVEIWATFYLARPKSVKRLFPHVPPDLDKLERGLFDALTQGGLWKDDSLVVRSHTAKIYADKHNTGVAVAVQVVKDAPNPIAPAVTKLLHKIAESS